MSQSDPALTSELLDDLRRQIYELQDLLRMERERNAQLETRLNPAAKVHPEIDDEGGLKRISLTGPKLWEDASENTIKQTFSNLQHLIDDRQITIRFKGLSISAFKAEQQITTVGSTLLSFLIGSGPKKRVDILKGLTGTILPGKLTLILGPPGSGKSTFMRALAGRLHLGSAKMKGDITYNRELPDPQKFLVPKIVGYVEQDDTHAPTLTVFETLEFAWRTTSGGSHAYALAKDEKSAEILHKADEKMVKVRNILTMLGLKGCQNTIVGNEMLRGVSGGQKKRVTLGEILVTPIRILFGDSITNGLDSATSFDIVRSLKLGSKFLGNTAVLALLQPTPEVYELFDEVLVLSQGQIIYHGPRESVLPYFDSIGYECPSHVDVADFLVQIPTPEGINFIKSGETRNTVPFSADQLAEAWKASQLFKDMLQDVEVKGGASTNTWRDHDREPYAGTRLFHTLLLIKLQALKLKRNVVFMRARIGQVVVIGIISATLFNNLDVFAYRSTMGFIFFAGMFLAMGTMSLIPEIFNDRAILYKQSASSFYPNMAFVMGQALVSYPLHIAESIVFSAIVYFAVGLADETGGRFLTFVLLVFLFSMVMGQLFRAISSFLPAVVLAMPVCGVSMVMMVLFSGFICPKDQIPDPWIWMYWINPMQYLIQSLVINEFTSDTYDFSYGPNNQRFGDIVLDSYGFYTDYEWVWYGFAVLVLFYFTFIVVNAFGLTYVRFTSASAPVVDMDSAPVDAAKTHQEEEELPFEKTEFAFQDVWYTVHLPSGEDLDLLRAVHGRFKPGTVTALMGSSGAGKTTLLDVLAGRKNSGIIKGVMAVNGKPKNDRLFRKQMAYVEQFDTLSPHDTAREAVEFSAALRLPRTVSAEQRKKWVNWVIKQLELDPLADCMIGSADAGGLSFEQRKRVSIGVEVVTNPAILFLDEPTTGLDSRAAQVLMRTIRRLAGTGRSIICTIHQPSSFIFDQFDALLLLRRGGQIVYFGDLGRHSSKLVAYLEAIPGVNPKTLNQNPATWMLDQIGAGTSTAASSVDFHEHYKKSALGSNNASEIAELCNDAILDEEGDSEGSTNLWSSVKIYDVISKSLSGKKSTLTDVEGSGHEEYAASDITQIRWLVWRSTLSYWRSPSYNVGRILISVLLALVFGSVYSRQNYRSEAEMNARVGVIYCTTMFSGIVSMMTVIPVIVGERAAFYREQQSNMYKVTYYEMATGIVELPYLAISTVVFVIPFFFIVGFDVGDVTVKFFWYWLFHGLYVMLMVFLGQLFAAVAPSAEIATMLAAVSNILNTLFCGFLIQSAEFPTFWKFMYWLSPLHYVLEGLVFTQSHKDDKTITLINKKKVTAEDFYPSTFTEWSYDHVTYDYVALIVFIVGFRILTFVALKYIRHDVR